MYYIKEHLIEGSPIPFSYYYHALSKGYDEENILENIEVIENSFMDAVEKQRSDLEHLVAGFRSKNGEKLRIAKKHFYETVIDEVIKKSSQKVGRLAFFLLFETLVHLEAKLRDRKFPEAYLIAAWEAARGQYGRCVDYCEILSRHGSPIDILVKSIVTPIWPGVISTTAEIQLEVETLLKLPEPLLQFKLLKLEQEVKFIQLCDKTFKKSPYQSTGELLYKRVTAILDVLDIQDRELHKTLCSVL